MVLKALSFWKSLINLVTSRKVLVCVFYKFLVFYEMAISHNSLCTSTSSSTASLGDAHWPGQFVTVLILLSQEASSSCTKYIPTLKPSEVRVGDTLQINVGVSLWQSKTLGYLGCSWRYIWHSFLSYLPTTSKLAHDFEICETQGRLLDDKSHRLCLTLNWKSGCDNLNRPP